MDNSTLRRRALISATVCLIALPGIIAGMIQALAAVNNDTVQWTSATLPAKRDFDRFCRQFESQETILVSWPGCTRQDARLGNLATLIRRASVSQNPPLLASVRTTAETWRDLEQSPAQWTEAEIRQRLEGFLLGLDGRTALAVVQLTAQGALQARAAVESLRQLAEQAGVPVKELKLAGNTVQVAGIDHASMQTMLFLAVPAAALVTAAAWFFLRSLALMATIGLLGGIAQASALALVHYGGAPMNGMLIIMPLLVFVICVSSCIHLIHYDSEAREEGKPEPAVIALQRGWFPCTLAVVTTAIGVLSLAVSRIGPLHDFGMYTAAALAITLLLVLTILPGVLSARRLPALPAPVPPSDERTMATKMLSLQRSRVWEALAAAIDRTHLWIVAACLAVCVVCAGGLFNIDTSMGIYDLFSPGHRILRDYEWLQDKLGPLLPSEVVLGFSVECPLSLHDRLELLDDVQQAIHRAIPAARIVSPLSLTIEPVRGGGLRQAAARRLVSRRLKQSLSDLEQMKYIANEGGHQLWRITVRQTSTRAQDLSATALAVQHAVEGELSRSFAARPEWLRVNYTGLSTLVAASQRELLRSLLISFASTSVLIGLTLIVGLRDLQLGLVSILPNFFPLFLVFGGLGWLGIPIDMGSLMTSSIGLGIAVDDTVHYLTWFRRGLRSGLDRNQAIRWAYQNCGFAMVQTTIICGAGLALFGLGEFRPAAQFGRTICILLVAALVGDLIFLPALLRGPLGRWLK